MLPPPPPVTIRLMGLSRGIFNVLVSLLLSLFYFRDKGATAGRKRKSEMQMEEKKQSNPSKPKENNDKRKEAKSERKTDVGSRMAQKLHSGTLNNIKLTR